MIKKNVIIFLIFILIFIIVGCKKEKKNYPPIINFFYIETEYGKNKIKEKNIVKVNVNVTDYDNDINYINVLASNGKIERVNSDFYYVAPEKINEDTLKLEVTDEKGNKATTTIAIKILEDKKKKITMMIYMAADSSLDSYSYSDLEEIKSANINDDNLNVVIYGDFKTTESGIYVKKGNSIEIDKKLNEFNTGDKENLTLFLNYCFEKYTAEKYILVFWGHGNGWEDDKISGKNYGPKNAIALDDSDDDSLDLWEVEDGIKNSNLKKVDMIYTDSCLMGMIEVLYQLKDVCDILLSSPEVTPGNGGDYKEIIEYIDKNINKNMNDIGIDIQKINLISYKPGGSQATGGSVIDNVVVSVFDMNKAKENSFFDEFKNIANKLYLEIATLKNYKFDFGNIISFDNDNKDYEVTNYVDIMTLLNQIKNGNFSEDLKNSIDNFSQKLKEITLYSDYQNGYYNKKEINYDKYDNNGNLLYKTCGLSVFFPFKEGQYTSLIQSYRYASKFGQESNWSSVIENYYK